jgi:RNA polymerase sigma-70 factor, ECF subfamily
LSGAANTGSLDPYPNKGVGLETAAAKDAITAVLSEGRDGREVLDELMPLVYDELRRMARGRLARERGPRTLSTTGLLHEAYLKLVDQTQVPVRSRAYFFAAAARAMRQVLVDGARRRGRLKRGSGEPPLDLADFQVAVDGFAAELSALDEALERLAAAYPRQASVVECRFFGGLSVEETAEALGLAERTVKRDWSMARAWLYRELHAAR